LYAPITSLGDPLTRKWVCTPSSCSESGPSVRWVFAGVGINACRFGLAPVLVVVAVAGDDVAPAEVGPELLEGLELVELLHADATKATAIVTVVKAWV